MKKMNNRGFSLVELIIVIAIMAILAAALAPQLMKYIEKSRNSTDSSTCASIKNSINAVVTDDDYYTAFMQVATGTEFEFDLGAKGVVTNPTVAINAITVGSNTVDIQTEIERVLSDLAAPKSSGETKYHVTITVDATNKTIGSILVETSPNKTASTAND